MEIAGRTALLTGATGGLGRAIAAELAGSGATLVLSGRREPDLLALAESLPGEDHRVAVADLAEDGEAERLAAAAAGVDILVANAGLPGAGWLAEFSAEEVKRALRVNLEAPMLLSRALFPEMLERGAGHLVFVSSLSGKSASPRTSVYNATKFGLRGFALGLRTDLAPRGIGVSLVSPGFVREAGMFADAGGKTPPGLGTTTPVAVAAAVRKAITADKVEIAVAPLLDRVAAHAGLLSPRASVLAQSGSVGQKAAAAVTDGHSKDKR
ncbi:MAG TPA: SDR family NAD(P)-dependent oxidoreductase [Solirubrobacterales bacterium]|nr:SDR family NAD(P)-dependent oxidoreductase [Solirubrobacterales bacterium]